MRTTLSLALLLVTSSAAPAALLSGASGTFTLPAATGTVAQTPGIPATLATVGSNHTGTWTAPAPSPWVGTYQGTGPIPNGASGSAASLNFSTLPLGYLPSSTFVVLSDLDSNENMTLQAFDSAGVLLTTHWLTDAVFLGGNDPAQLIQDYMPTWTFDSLTGIYALKGETFAGNPTLNTVLLTGADVSRIEVTKQTNAGFSLNAPTAVPEPSTWLLAAAGLLLGARRRRR